MMKKYLFLLILVFFGANIGAQKAVVFGNISDLETKLPVDFATVYIENTNIATESAIDGSYRLEIDANKVFRLVVSRLGYENAYYSIPKMDKNKKRLVNIKLAPQESDIEIVVTESRVEDVGMVREEVTELKHIPSASGNLESVLPSIALGVSTGTGGELSSQYNVRGGNYDENLVYVNDFEIFRPQLIRSGQQEGLSFPNIDLVRDLSFSSGGFQSKYGDKLSSVLDIKYKRPDESAGSVSMSFLGLAAHIEGSKRIGANAYNKFRYLVGARYKTTKYLLGSLDTKGEYLPEFTDIQAYLTYDITRDLQIGVLGNYNNSVYDFTPVSRSTTLGLITRALRFTSVFEGGERDKFKNGTTGVAFTFVPERDKDPLYLKLLFSDYRSNEEENFDILGYYRLAEIETDLGSDNFGTEVAVLGVGTQHQYTRNYLYNHIYNIAHKGGYEIQLEGDAIKSHFVQWGVKYQNETFIDQLNEWERIDSAGFSLPINAENLNLSSVLKTENDIFSSRISGFVQDSYSYLDEDVREFKITGGVRANYRKLSEELVVSPRVQFLYKPLQWDNDISFKLSSGVYYQPPIYREMRRIDGSVNTKLKSQKSIHFVGGMSYDFYWRSMSEKPFRLITELYYKTMSNLVSYEIDNVRIRYSGENDSEGFATGIDIRLNGEFVPGAESWVNLSFLKTEENILGVDHLQYNRDDPEHPKVVNSVPRPTDQFMTLSMFFQDYLPHNENFKMHLNLAIGTGLPFGVKGNNREYRNAFRYKPYHRVDIGFGYQIWKSDWKKRRPHHPFSFSKNAWFSLEVFNMLEVANVASNTWIKTVTNSQYAIPNYLTSRRVNLRLRIDI
ncbi:MAG: carboxypeptidase-like regulatory domain-containing protein [Saprospiraceae bacterium]